MQPRDNSGLIVLAVLQMLGQLLYVVWGLSVLVWDELSGGAARVRKYEADRLASIAAENRRKKEEADREANRIYQKHLQQVRQREVNRLVEKEKVAQQKRVEAEKKEKLERLWATTKCSNPKLNDRVL